MKRPVGMMLMALCLIVLCFISQPISAEQQWSPDKAIDLENGVAVTGLSGNAGEWLHYKINVNAGASNLMFKISGGSGDADLYTRFGSQPTRSSWDCRPYRSDSNEQCEVAAPQSGYYYVSIHGYRPFANIALEASYTDGGTQPNDELINGQARTLSGAAGEWQHFYITVPADSTNLVMEISGGSGDADIYTLFGSRPTGTNWDCRPYRSDSNEQCTVASPQAGRYYVSIHGYRNYSNITLKASYTGGGTPSNDELVNGQARTISGAAGEWRHFYINVPANSANLVMEISGGSGDADIYTLFGAQPTSSNWDCRPYSNGNNEQCSVPSPQAGKYHVSLFGYTAYSNTSLKASYTDGGVPPGDKTFIITAVHDNLDNQDMYILGNGLIGLGYTQAVENTNVSSSELRDYLGRTVTTVYHTGHGSTGSVATSDGAVSVSGTTLRAENSFFATCLTLADTSWKNAFAPTAQTLMGYTNFSYDFTDNTVCHNMVNELGNNRSYKLAWYLSNAGISSLSDRWAEYVREGSNIVEYSARTGNIPVASAGAFIVLEASGRVKASEGLVANTRKFETSFGMTATIAPAATTTYAADEGFGALGPVSMTEAEALDLCEAWLVQNGGLPDDAVLDRVTPVRKRVSANEPAETVGYSIRYQRTLQGIRVSGNRVADHISVLVGQNTVLAASRYWPELSASPAVSNGQGALLGISEAIQSAAEEIAAVVKGNATIHLIDAEPVYGTYGPDVVADDLIPAYKVRSEDGHIFVINALTGELLL